MKFSRIFRMRDLAIQWDNAHDMQAFDGARTPWFTPALGKASSSGLVRLGDHVPGGRRTRLSLLLRQLWRADFVEPKDMQAMVDLAKRH